MTGGIYGEVMNNDNRYNIYCDESCHAVSYINRDLCSSDAKLKIVEHIKKISGYSLRARTLLREDKFNLFFWTPKESEI